MVRLRHLIAVVASAFIIPPHRRHNFAFATMKSAEPSAYISGPVLAAIKDSETYKTTPRAAIGGTRISETLLRSMSDSYCLWSFRMTASELIELTEVLEIPEIIITSARYVFSGVEALGLTLARFRSAGDINELSTRFNRSPSSISQIVNDVVLSTDQRWSHLLDFDHIHLLSPANLTLYANKIHAAGAPLDSIWGFLDCAIRRIARPKHYQRVAYNGYKKYHALKYQAIMLPNHPMQYLYQVKGL